MIILHISSFILVWVWIILSIRLILSIRWIKKRQAEYLIVFLLHEYGFSEKEFDETLYSIPNILYWNIGILILIASSNIFTWILRAI